MQPFTRRRLLQAGAATAGAAALRPPPATAAGTAPATAATAATDDPGDPADLSVLEALAALDRRRLSARELAEACIRRIDALEPTIQAFVTRTDERALDAAARTDGRRAAGRRVAPLAGIPVGLKDLYHVAGVPTTAGSRVLADFVPDHDATVWARLRDAGAGLLGKTNTHEFAYGTNTPPTRNPWDTTRNPGGSSGGSGAALAARMLPLATGSDTGGSLRLPAAVNGISSLRGTYGTVSRHGIVALAWSMDIGGIMARRMADVALVHALVTGPDPLDPTTSDRSPGEADLAVRSLAGRRVGVPETYFWDGVEEGIASVCRDALDLLRELGAEVVEVPVPASNPQVLADIGVYETTNLAEATSYHRGWMRSEEAALYDPGVSSLLADGESITAADYLDAQRLRGVYAREWAEVFATHRLDAVAHPTTPEQPRPQVPSQSFAVGVPIRLTRAWPVVGFPSLSVPVGFDPAGLPVGLCLSGRPFTDAGLLELGIAVDEELGSWRIRPPLVEALA
jgi:aspartyl-tRNA(Asn)/glutamyl-tRNA(Gln) amidotransferase subunit A